MKSEPTSISQVTGSNSNSTEEVKRLRKVFTTLAKMMKQYEVPAEIGKIIIKEAGRGG